MKKNIITCLCCLLFCGCTINYNIIIDENKKMNEEVVINFDGSEISNLDMSLEQFAENRKEATKQQLEKYGFTSSYEIKNNILTYNLKRKDNDINKINSMYEFQQMYNSIFTEKVNGLYKIYTIGTYNGAPLFDKSDSFDAIFNADSLNINIQFYNEIISSNADYCDNETNTCTWKYDKNTKEKTIEVNLSDNVLEQFKGKNKINKNNKNNIDTILLIIIPFLFILVIILYALNLNKKRNKL